VMAATGVGARGHAHHQHRRNEHARCPHGPQPPLVPAGTTREGGLGFDWRNSSWQGLAAQVGFTRLAASMMRNSGKAELRCPPRVACLSRKRRGCPAPQTSLRSLRKL
jgi:hypothetical protein